MLTGAISNEGGKPTEERRWESLRQDAWEAGRGRDKENSPLEAGVN
jgi:hypothetical protein